MIRRLSLLALAAAFGCAAKAPPIDPAASPDPEIREIARAFDATVRQLREDPETRWHSGWTGNLTVHALGGRHRGLCHEWRDAVYAGVAPTALRLGWAPTTIVVNWGHAGEHHAVLVYDPACWPGAPALDDPPDSGAYVLDAWGRGRADVYTLRDWLSRQRRVTRPPEVVEPTRAGRP